VAPERSVGAMAMDEADVEMLRERVRRLEWEVRLWRRLAAAVMVVAMLFALVAMRG
jgi:hypothetical protein